MFNEAFCDLEKKATHMRRDSHAPGYGRAGMRMTPMLFSDRLAREEKEVYGSTHQTIKSSKQHTGNKMCFLRTNESESNLLSRVFLYFLLQADKTCHHICTIHRDEEHLLTLPIPTC
jgi:hypothetical protein